MKLHGIIVGMGFPKSEQFLVFADVDIVDQCPGLCCLVGCDHLLRNAAQLIRLAIRNFKLVKKYQFGLRS